MFPVRVDAAHPAHLVLRRLLPARVLRPLRRRQECRQPARQEPQARGEPGKVPQYVSTVVCFKNGQIVKIANNCKIDQLSSMS